MTVLRIIPESLPPECIRPATCSQDAIPARCATCGHGYAKAPRVRPPEQWLEDYKVGFEALVKRQNEVIFGTKKSEE